MDLSYYLVEPAPHSKTSSYATVVITSPEQHLASSQGSQNRAGIVTHAKMLHR